MAARARRLGHLRVPRRYFTSDGLALGKFIQNQRDAFGAKAGRRLTAQQADELDRIDLSWRDGVMPPAYGGDGAGAPSQGDGPGARKSSDGS
ncbi:MAG: helicase associated domain-containing protein [Actinobacteria bacterium]|nr:helicase associated domain-containing protein [Actinomycetota bacterium]